LFVDLALEEFRVATSSGNEIQGGYQQNALRPRVSQDECRRRWQHAIERDHELAHAANVEARHTGVKKHACREVALTIIIPVLHTPALTSLPDRSVLYMASERRLLAGCPPAVDVCSQIVHCQLSTLRTVIAPYKVRRPCYRVHLVVYLEHVLVLTGSWLLQPTQSTKPNAVCKPGEVSQSHILGLAHGAMPCGDKRVG